MKPIKIGKYTISWKFIFLIAVTLLIIYMKMRANGTAIGVEDTLQLLGLK